jgi:hypothetical protein
MSMAGGLTGIHTMFTMRSWNVNENIPIKCYNILQNSQRTQTTAALIVEAELIFVAVGSRRGSKENSPYRQINQRIGVWDSVLRSCALFLNFKCKINLDNEPMECYHGKKQKK